MKARWVKLQLTISTGDMMEDKPTINEDKGHFKAYFPRTFVGYADEYDVIYDMAKNAAPTDRNWFDYGERFVDCGDSKLGKALSDAIDEVVEEKLTKYMGVALRQGFLDGLMETYIEMHVSTLNDEHNTVKIGSEIEAIDAERDIAHIDLWLDGELDYTIHQPKLVEETDTHVTLRFKKDQ